MSTHPEELSQQEQPKAASIEIEGAKYYLHQRMVFTADGEKRTIYSFFKHQRNDSLFGPAQVPAGYEMRMGSNKLPMLVKKA